MGSRHRRSLPTGKEILLLTNLGWVFSKAWSLGYPSRWICCAINVYQQIDIVRIAGTGRESDIPTNQQPWVLQDVLEAMC